VTDDLPFSYGDPEPVVSTRTPKRHRHRWAVFQRFLDGDVWHEDVKACPQCGALQNAALSRRSKNNRSRGNAQEREWAKRLGLRRTGQYGGPDDATNGLFVGQAKSMATARFPGWMSDELAKLPRTDGRVPILGILETPGPGRRPRRLVVVEESDWIALHGGEE
jgi:hypothetical protein